MNRRSLITLGAIIVLVVGLGVYRSHLRGESGHPEAAPEPGHGQPGLLDFGRGECAACKKMEPVLEELAEKHEGRIVITYVDLNVPENRQRSNRLGVRVIPTQILIDAEGNEVVRHEGFWSVEDIELEMEVLEWIPPR